MNVRENILNELIELKGENLIKDYSIKNDESKLIEFVIVTLEGEHLKIITTDEYCYKIVNLEYDNKIYESFESMLRAHSDKYTESFGTQLFNKLSKFSEGIDENLILK